MHRRAVAPVIYTTSPVSTPPQTRVIHGRSAMVRRQSIRRFYSRTVPIKEAGVNGLTHEALLAIVIDRLRSFQAGPFASTMNEQALRHIEQGLDHLQQRTRERIKRGVEGTHKT